MQYSLLVELYIFTIEYLLTITGSSTDVMHRKLTNIRCLLHILAKETFPKSAHLTRQKTAQTVYLKIWRLQKDCKFLFLTAERL